MTLSSTLSAGNGRTSWNVRAMPRRHTTSGAQPVDRARRQSVIAPASGAIAPAIMLNSVVLPAPFGPITAKISPSGTVEAHAVDGDQAAEAFADGVERKQRRHRLPSVDAEPARQPRPDALRQRHDDEQQANAVEHLLGAGQIEAERRHDRGHRLRQAGEHERAQHRPEQRTDAADDRTENHLDRAARC